jgi:hypothetical protein
MGEILPSGKNEKKKQQTKRNLNPIEPLSPPFLLFSLPSILPWEQGRKKGKLETLLCFFYNKAEVDESSRSRYQLDFTTSSCLLHRLWK